MKIHFLWLGKSKQKSYQELIDLYRSRLKHYSSITIQELKEPKLKGLSIDQQKVAEAKEFLPQLQASDYVVLLDERGKHMTSMEMSKWWQHKMNISIHRCVFIIAGPYGAGALLKQRADYKMSLSHLTLTHDMARILILEQVYRSHTILRGEKYHNE